MVSPQFSNCVVMDDFAIEMEKLQRGDVISRELAFKIRNQNGVCERFFPLISFVLQRINNSLTIEGYFTGYRSIRYDLISKNGSWCRPFISDDLPSMCGSVILNEWNGQDLF